MCATYESTAGATRCVSRRLLAVGVSHEGAGAAVSPWSSAGMAEGVRLQWRQADAWIGDQPPVGLAVAAFSWEKPVWTKAETELAALLAGVAEQSAHDCSGAKWR